jgi:S1-C subfamily serine protease
MPKPTSHAHKQHHVAPKPPSKFLWVMEAALISLGIFAVLSVLLIIYLAFTNNRRAQDAIKSLTGLTLTQDVTEVNRSIRSNLGYAITINTDQQKAEATKPNGEVVTGDVVYNQSDYTSVSVFNKVNSDASNIDSSSRVKSTYLTIESSNNINFFNQLRAQYGLNNSEQELLEKYYLPQNSSDKSYELEAKQKVNISGVEYTKLNWQITTESKIKIKTSQTDYFTIQNNRPYKVTVYQNAGYDPKDLSDFTTLVAKISYFRPSEASLVTNQEKKPKRFLPGLVAEAATRLISKDSAIQVVAKNMPSVVKIASVYCIDFNLILDKISEPVNTGCAGGTGSGFIVSPSGYVATNGHVVKFTPLDVLVDSIYLQNKQVTRAYLNFLLKTGKIDETTANYYYAQSIEGNQKVQDDLVSSLQLLPDQTSTKATNEQGYYAVQLSNQAVKFDEANIKNFNYGDSIVRANLVDINYDPYVDVAKDGFKSSDVALLKLDGTREYPYLSLGSIDGLGSGSALTVIGFPGLAENELVNTSESVPTATEGKVSSIRTANGTTNKLIQSDVSIAHGNSGGPAINSNGEVVGIATYAIEEQGAQVNYMRDIADLKSLLSKNNIGLPSLASGSEKLWQDGLSKYAKAYYSSAIADFKKVKQIYPQNRLVDEFIAKAEAAKKDGKEAIAPEVYLTIVIIAIVVIFVPGIILFFVVRHHRKRKIIHQQYSNQIADKSLLTPQSVNTQLSAGENKANQKTDMISHATGPERSNYQPKDTTNG